MNVNGKGSWFGGPGDPSDSGHTATGGTTKEPGIAVYNHGTLGGYWRVTAPNGRSVVIKQTDIGPAPETGRKIDVTYSALGQFGYGEHNFPTDGQFRATYLGRNAKGASSTPSPAATPGLPAVSRTSQPSMPSFDQQGFKTAQKRAILGKLISSEKGAKDNPLLATGLVSTREPQRGEYEHPGEIVAEHHTPQGTGQVIKTPGGPSLYVPPAPTKSLGLPMTGQPHQSAPTGQKAAPSPQVAAKQGLEHARQDPAAQQKAAIEKRLANAPTASLEKYGYTRRKGKIVPK